MLLRSGNPILVKIWKWLKLVNSVAFIKKFYVNHVNIRIWLLLLTFSVLQWMKQTSKLVNLNISAKVRYTSLVKISHWLKLLYVCSIHQENMRKSCLQLNLIIFLTFTVLQWMKTNFKVSQIWIFLLMSGDEILVKIWK